MSPDDDRARAVLAGRGEADEVHAGRHSGRERGGVRARRPDAIGEYGHLAAERIVDGEPGVREGGKRIAERGRAGGGVTTQGP